MVRFEDNANCNCEMKGEKHHKTKHVVRQILSDVSIPVEYIF